MSGWDFKVRGVANGLHQHMKAGDVIVETVHLGVSSSQMEVQVWQSRMKKERYIDHCELIDMRAGGVETIHRIRHDTTIDWQAMYARVHRV